MSDQSGRNCPALARKNVETRSISPEVFADVEAVAGRAEREAIVRGYASLAGFAPDQVNRG